MIEMIRQGLQADGITVSISKLCRWFNVPRRSVYYRPVKAEPKVQARFAEQIKAMIEESPSFGYRTVAYLLGFNKNTVQQSSSSWVGRFANVPSASGRAFKRCRQWLRHRTSAGRPTCAASGPAETVGQRWRW